MKLSQMQRAFTRMVADLIQYAYESGYELTFGDAYRDPRVHGVVGEKKSYSSANSNHKLRLAIDLNLWVDGVYVTTSEHKARGNLHEYWSSIGGAERIPEDANHFSIEYRGRR